MCVRLLNIRIQTIKLGVSPPTNDIIGLDCHSIGQSNISIRPTTAERNQSQPNVGVPHISHPDQLERTQNFSVQIRIIGSEIQRH
jgi:hypothetical protein